MEDMKVIEMEPEVEHSEDKDPLLIEFKRPYHFEGQEYKNIDLNGLERLKARDLIQIQKDIPNGYANPSPEVTLEYACIVAAKVTRQPIEFFEGLPPVDSIKLKNRIVNFFYDNEE